MELKPNLAVDGKGSGVLCAQGKQIVEKSNGFIGE